MFAAYTISHGRRVAAVPGTRVTHRDRPASAPDQRPGAPNLELPTKAPSPGSLHLVLLALDSFLIFFDRLRLLLVGMNRSRRFGI